MLRFFGLHIYWAVMGFAHFKQYVCNMCANYERILCAHIVCTNGTPVMCVLYMRAQIVRAYILCTLYSCEAAI